MATVEYRLYRRRWGVLATVILSNFTCFTQVTSYLAVAARAAEYFDADDVKGRVKKYWKS